MLELKNIVKKYDENVILNDVNLKIKDGEMIAIVGSSGAGKSTLLNIIGLLEEADEGEVLYNNESIYPQTYEATIAMRNKISYLFQNYALVESMTVYENLLIALKYTKYNKKEKTKMIQQALMKVGLHNDMNRIVFTLSGGEQQRVALARVILKKSDIILCDEPTGSLDKVNSQIIINLLLKCKDEGKTIIIVTHDSDVAKQCDRIIDINEYH